MTYPILLHRWTHLKHPNGQQELAPKLAKNRIAHFKDTTTFYEVGYSNGTVIEMWVDNDWAYRWTVPEDEDATEYFFNTVFNWVAGLTWEDSNQLDDMWE